VAATLGYAVSLFAGLRIHDRLTPAFRPMCPVWDRPRRLLRLPRQPRRWRFAAAWLADRLERAEISPGAAS